MALQQKIETFRVVLRNFQHQCRVAIKGTLRHHDHLNVLEGEAVTDSVVRIGKTAGRSFVTEPRPLREPVLGVRASLAFGVPETPRTRTAEETARITHS